MKCLPQSRMAMAQGHILHDWHAEVLALRTFNRFLIDECEDLLRKSFAQGKEDQWVKWRDEDRRYLNPSADHQPFALCDDVTIHMYCSEAPCGDASMELSMAEQQDSTPWEKEQNVGPDGLLGRGHFDRLGIVRRKPSRPDAPATLSKSCSDKLTLKQCTSLLSGLTSLLLHPGNVYLSTVVLPEKQYIHSAVERAFGASGRMAPLIHQDVQRRWEEHGYAFRPFQVQTTSKEFCFAKGSTSHMTVVPSNLSTLRTPDRQEILINGVLQGRKQLDPKGASCVSRAKVWQSIRDVAVLAGLPVLMNVLQKTTYAEVKEEGALKNREEVKMEARAMALQGWKRNKGDECWNLPKS